jgi:hypothetical protein
LSFSGNFDCRRPGILIVARQFLVFLPKTDSGKIDLKWQKKLSDKVSQAHGVLVEARDKLDKAILAVEAAIESLL